MKNLTMSVGRDHNYPLHGRYEYVVFLGEIVVLRETGFRSKRAAEKAGRAKAALEFNPPAE